MHNVCVPSVGIHLVVKLLNVTELHLWLCIRIDCLTGQIRLRIVVPNCLHRIVFVIVNSFTVSYEVFQLLMHFGNILKLLGLDCVAYHRFIVKLLCNFILIRILWLLELFVAYLLLTVFLWKICIWRLVRRIVPQDLLAIPLQLRIRLWLLTLRILWLRIRLADNHSFDDAASLALVIIIVIACVVVVHMAVEIGVRIKVVLESIIMTLTLIIVHLKISKSILI